MLKHIIVLTLCFMAYIIGNVDAGPKRNFEAETSSSQPKRRATMMLGPNAHLMPRQKSAELSVFKAGLLLERQTEFGRLVKCYKQMCLNGLAVKKPENGIQLQEHPYYEPNPDLQKGIMNQSEFYKILSKIYNENNVLTENVNGEILPMFNCANLDTGEKFKALKKSLTNELVQNIYMQHRVNALAKNHKNNELTDEPLKTFVFNWASDHPKVFVRSVSAFCAKYGSNPDDVFKLNNPRK